MTEWPTTLWPPLRIASSNARLAGLGDHAGDVRIGRDADDRRRHLVEAPVEHGPGVVVLRVAWRDHTPFDVLAEPECELGVVTSWSASGNLLFGRYAFIPYQTQVTK